MTARPPNSHECVYFGRKLSDVVCGDIGVSDGYVVIGSECDDQIYFGRQAAKDGVRMLKERVTLTAFKDGEGGHLVDIDMEDLLRFAVKNCRGIYTRVLDEELRVMATDGYQPGSSYK